MHVSMCVKRLTRRNRLIQLWKLAVLNVHCGLLGGKLSKAGVMDEVRSQPADTPGVGRVNLAFYSRLQVLV